MMILNAVLDITSLTIVGIFLLVTLLLGLYAGRNVKDFEDYALGGRRFSTITLVLTFLATNIGGTSVIGECNTVYQYGIICTVASLGVVIQALLSAFIFGPKLISFKKTYTLGGIMENYFGRKIKIFTGILTFLYCVFMISMGFHISGKICKGFLNIEPFYSIIITAIILGLYSVIGGIKSVTYTDIFQFLCIIIGIPIILNVALRISGGYKVIFTSLPVEKIKIINHEKFYYYLSCFLVWSIFPLGLTCPPLLQRILMSKTKKQVKNLFLTISVVDPIFRIMIMVLGLSIFIIYPNISKEKDVLSYFILNAQLTFFVKITVIIAIFAVLMSSLDSYLHSAGVVFSSDIISPLFNRNETNKIKDAKLGIFFYKFDFYYSLTKIYIFFKSKFMGR